MFRFSFPKQIVGLIFLFAAAGYAAQVQQAHPMSIEGHGCKEAGSPPSELHPGDKFKVCVTFVSDLTSETSISVIFNLQTASAEVGKPFRGSMIDSYVVVHAPSQQVEIELTVPTPITSGDYLLTGLSAHNSHGTYGYNINADRKLIVTVRSPDDYRFPAIRDIGLKADHP